MNDTLTKSNINLYAILRNLEELCKMDNQAKSLIKGKNISIQFYVKNGPCAILSFKNGKCTLKKGIGKCNIKLYFKTPRHLNSMFEGTANPIPLKGFTKIKFLTKDFPKLTDRLTYYLKPTPLLLKDPLYFKINTFLTLYTALFALVEIGNSDEIGKLIAKRIPNGVISVSVLNGGPSVILTAKDGYLEAKKGISHSPRALMTFSDINTANEVLNGTVDTYSCIATEKIKMKGFIPMIDNMNKLLSKVPLYL